MYEIVSVAKSCGSVSIGIVSMSGSFGDSSDTKYDGEMGGVIVAAAFELAAPDDLPTYGSYFDLNSFQAFVNPICKREKSCGI